MVPEFINKRPAQYLFLLWKVFMCIQDALYFFNPGNVITGKDRIQVDGTDPIHLFKKQEKEKPQIVFCIKKLSLFKKAIESFLLKWHLAEWYWSAHFPSYKCYNKPRFGQWCTDTYHTLVVRKIIGNCKINGWQYRVFEWQIKGILLYSASLPFKQAKLYGNKRFILEHCIQLNCIPGNPEYLPVFALKNIKYGQYFIFLCYFCSHYKRKIKHWF